MTEKERRHAWYLENSEKVKEVAKQWAINNPERAKELNKKKSKKYELANREKRRLKSKLYYHEHKEKSKEATRRHYLEHKDRHQGYSRKRLYGITKEQFELMLASQDHKCSICKIFLDKPFVDHDHNTNKVRALLCKACNSFIGLAKESKDILLSAIQYLEKHKE